MRWSITVALVLLAVVLAAVIWRMQGGEEAGVSQQRVAMGRLYPHDIGALTGFEIVYPERNFRLAKREDGWWLEAPSEDRADPETVEQMLNTLDLQDVTRWLPPPAKGQLQEFGLLAPRLELRFETAAGWDTLRFGDLNEIEKRLWVSTSWRDSLALVSTLLRTHFMKGRFEIVDKRPMSGTDRADIESIQIDNRWGEFELVRENGKWTIMRPERYRADDRRVTQLVESLWGETIIDFVDMTPKKYNALRFDEPKATVTVKLQGEERKQRLLIGQPFYLMHHAFNPDRSSAFLLDSLACAPILESFSAYMSTVLFSFAPNMTSAIVGPNGRLERIGVNQWWWEDESGNRMSGKDISRLLTQMIRLPTERVEALLPRKDQLRAWHLSEPAHVYELHFEHTEDVLRLEAGKAAGDRVYFRRSDYPTVYSLPASSLDFTWPGFAEVDSLAAAGQKSQ